MRKLLLLSLLLTAQLGFGQSQGIANPEKAQIIERLKQIENSYINKLDFDERRRAIQLMNEILSRLQSIAIAPVPTATAQPIVVNPVMNDSAFKDLLDQVNNEMTDGEKTKMILAIVSHGYISANQLAQLIAAYTWDSDREACLEGAYKYVYDKPSISVVLGYFKSSITKGKVLDFIKNYKQ